MVLIVVACGRAEAPKSDGVSSGYSDESARLSAGEARRSVAAGSASGNAAVEQSATAASPVAAPTPPTPTPPTPMPPSAASDAGVRPASMIVRTGDASVEVDSLERAVAQVRAIAQRVGGFVANTSLSSGRDQLRSATLELKVPSPRFDEVVVGLKPIGRVEAVNVRAEDVGEEYVDLAAREANARRLEARLITLLERSTARLSDVLAVERELARVREDIERAEGRLRFLRTRVAMSTFEVTVHEPPPIVARTGSKSPIAEAFRDAWRNFVGFVAWLIAASGVLIPLAALGALVWWLTRGWRRERRERIAAARATTRAAAVAPEASRD